MTPSGPKTWVAVVLSLLCTGLGHLYCGRTARGLVLFLLSLLFVPVVVLVALAPPSGVGLALLVVDGVGFPLLVLFAVIDSARIARRLRDGIERRDYQRPAVYALFAIVGLLFPLGSSVYLRAHVVEAFRIASGSMEPTLRRGDRILVDKLGGRPLKRGDVVVFRHGSDPERNYVKRLVGLPGDRVEVRDGRVYVNGEPLPDPKADPGATPDLPEQPVPPGCYFVLGEHLANSKDSRDFGPVAADTIVGPAVYVLGAGRFGVLRQR